MPCVPPLPPLWIPAIAGMTRPASLTGAAYFRTNVEVGGRYGAVISVATGARGRGGNHLLRIRVRAMLSYRITTEVVGTTGLPAAWPWLGTNPPRRITLTPHPYIVGPLVEQSTT